MPKPLSSSHKQPKAQRVIFSYGPLPLENQSQHYMHSYEEEDDQMRIVPNRMCGKLTMTTASSVLWLVTANVAMAVDDVSTTNSSETNNMMISNFGKWFFLVYVVVSILAGMKEMGTRIQTFLSKSKEDN